MKRHLLFVILFLSIKLSAQVNFTKVDEFARNYNGRFSDVPSLAKGLTSGFDTQQEKVRAIFIWITENISYDYDQYLKNKKKGSTEVKTEELKASSAQELAAKQAALKKKWRDEAVRDSIKNIGNLLSRKKGVCEDYSTLFTALCTEAGIKSGIVTGSIKAANGRVVMNDHAWNWVEIDQKRYLLDATWASGIVDYDKEKFIKNYNEGYYLTAPEMLILNHFPEKPEYQMLERPLTLDEFRKQQLFGSGYFKFKVKSISPNTLVLKDGKLNVTVLFGIRPHEVFLAYKQTGLIKIPVTSDSIAITYEPKKRMNNIEIWADNEFIVALDVK